MRLRFDNSLVFFDPVNDDDAIHLYEAHQVSRQFKPMVNHFGKWTPTEGFNIPIKTKWDRRKDMTGVNIKAATIHVKIRMTILCLLL